MGQPEAPGESAELFTSREDVDRWEREALASASMTLWKSRYLVAMKWLRKAEESPDGR